MTRPTGTAARLLLVATLLVAARAGAAPDVPPVPEGARDGEIVEIDGALYEVVGAALWPLDENGERIPSAAPPGAPAAAAASTGPNDPAPNEASSAAASKDAVSVTGSRLDRRPSSSIVRTETISGEELRERGATDLGEVLDDQAGIQLQSAFGLGQNVSIDGLDGRHVLILVDGRPVAGRVNNQVDVSRIPVSASSIERIEIVRGPMSALYGSEALGGVVNIITKRPTAGASGEADLSARFVEGAVWTTGSIHGAGALGPIGARLDVASTSTPSIDQGGYDAAKNAVLPRPDLRTDTPDRRSTQVMGEVDVFLSGDWLAKAQGSYDVAESSARLATGVPFREHTTNAEAQLAASVEGDLAPGHQLTFDARVVRFTHLFEKNPFGEAPDSPPFCEHKATSGLRFFDPACPAAPAPKTHLTHDESRAEARYTGTLLQEAPFVDELGLSGGVVVVREHVVRLNGEGEDTIPGGGERTTASSYGELLWRPTPWLALLPGARLDAFTPALDDAWGAAFGPKLSARVDLPAGVALRASYGRGFRLPSFQERFLRFDHSELGYVVEGNPALRPETSHGARAEILYAPLQGIELGVEAFTNLVEDLISERSSSTTEDGFPIFVYENVGRANTSGVNARASLRGMWGFSLDLTYQWLRAVDASVCPDDNPWFCEAPPLPLRPTHTLYGKLRYEVAQTGTTLFTYADFTSERPLAVDAGLSSPAALLVGVGVRQPLFDHAELTVSLDNLLDSYHPVYGPKPGRHATATVRAFF